MTSDGDATVRESDPLTRAGVDGVAIKPAAVDPARATALSVDRIVVDFEGREHVPDAAVLRDVARDREVRATVPVRAEGFDPSGADDLLRALPDAVGRIFVAGHPAYLSAEERGKRVAPRLAAAVDRAPDPWVGTEAIERVALAVGGTQFELLAGGTEATVRSLRAARVDRPIAVYAPTAFATDEDALLDALGGYVARRSQVAERLPPGASVDATATERARETLLVGIDEFALTGTPGDVADRVDGLREAGVDHVVAYPARGLDPLLE